MAGLACLAGPATWAAVPVTMCSTRGSKMQRRAKAVAVQCSAVQCQPGASPVPVWCGAVRPAGVSITCIVNNTCVPVLCVHPATPRPGWQPARVYRALGGRDAPYRAQWRPTTDGGAVVPDADCMSRPGQLRYCGAGRSGRAWP